MKFEWDEEKNIINKEKHKISFETAAYVFDDPYYIEECFLIYVRPQGKKSTLWICFNAYRLSLWDTPYSRGFML